MVMFSFREQWQTYFSIFIVSSQENHLEAQYSFLKMQRLSFRKEISPKCYYKV